MVRNPCDVVDPDLLWRQSRGPRKVQREPAPVEVVRRRIKDDEDIPAIDATAATTPPPLQGAMTRTRARQLNQQVISFLRATPNIHENMMLPKVGVCVSLSNDGPSMDARDKRWSMYVQGDGSRSAHDRDDYATNGQQAKDAAH